MESPSPEFVRSIASRTLHTSALAIERFPTGSANWVYDVTSDSGSRIVVRVHEHASTCAAAIYWSKTLRPMGVPLPTLLESHVEEGPHRSWIILERLPGVDLGDAYPSLTLEQKRAVAREIVRVQTTVATLPVGGGFGFVESPRDWPHRKWVDVVHAELNRAARRIRAVGVVDPGNVQRVASRLAEFEVYFNTIHPTAFLDDTTTKNVLIDKGRLMGIVDVDSICYGDALFTPGLTRASLLNRGYDTDYIDCWLDAIGATDMQHRVVRLYSALFCVNFLSELGQRFNRDSAPPVDVDDVERLESVLEGTLATLG